LKSISSRLANVHSSIDLKSTVRRGVTTTTKDPHSTPVIKGSTSFK